MPPFLIGVLLLAGGAVAWAALKPPSNTPAPPPGESWPSTSLPYIQDATAPLTMITGFISAQKKAMMLMLLRMGYMPMDAWNTWAAQGYQLADADLQQSRTIAAQNDVQGAVDSKPWVVPIARFIQDYNLTNALQQANAAAGDTGADAALYNAVLYNYKALFA